jgi:hypothetical protein
MSREWTQSEKQMLGEFVGACGWLSAHFDHNVNIIPKFFESHPLMPITWETLTIAVKSSELLPDPYQPNARDRLQIGEVAAPPAPRLWSAPARPAPEPEKPRLLNNALLPSHGNKQQSMPPWFKPATAESPAELKRLREEVRKLRTIETRDNLPVTGSER